MPTGYYILMDIQKQALLIAERIIYVTSGDYGATLSGEDFVIVNFPLATASYALSVATNFLSTALIAWQAWCAFISYLISVSLLTVKIREYRVSVKRYLNSHGKSTSVERILALWVESGVIYLCFWVRAMRLCTTALILISYLAGGLRTHEPRL